MARIALLFLAYNPIDVFRTMIIHYAMIFLYDVLFPYEQSLKNWYINMEVTMNCKMKMWLFMIAIIAIVPHAGSSREFGSVEGESDDAVVTRWGKTITFNWDQELPGGYVENLELRLTIDNYWYIRSVYSRINHDHGLYYRFVLGDPFYQNIRSLASALRGLAQSYCMNEVDLALSFVQALPYQKMGHYQRYAFETYFDGQGDCSDTSVLFAALLQALGYGAVFIKFEDHLAVGVLCPPDMEGTYWVFNGRRYYYAETTGRGYQIGQCPEKFQSSADVTPVCALRW